MLQTSIENNCAFKTVSCLSLRNEQATEGMFICFMDEKNGVKSIHEENGAFHILCAMQRTVKKMSEADLYLTILYIQTGYYTVRSYGYLVEKSRSCGGAV